MVAVKSGAEDFGMEEEGCHQPYSDEGEGGDENAGTFQSISTYVVLCFNIRSTVWRQFILV